MMLLISKVESFPWSQKMVILKHLNDWKGLYEVDVGLDNSDSASDLLVAYMDFNSDS